MLPTPMISDFDRFCAHSPLNFLSTRKDGQEQPDGAAANRFPECPPKAASAIGASALHRKSSLQLYHIPHIQR